MKRALRVAGAAVLALGGTIAAGTGASGVVAPVDGCTDAGDEYFPDDVCQLVVETDAVCENDVPFLAYRVQLEGGSATALTMTWINPEGDDVVLEDLPLTGRVMWPGATVDADGNPTDWPGWAQQTDGSWLVGDEYDWSVPDVDVHIAVNPDTTVAVSYPGATEQCVAAPTGGASGTGVAQAANPTSDAPTASGSASGSAGTAVLSETGFSGTTLLGVAGGLLVGGIVLLITGRARSRAED